MSDAPRLLGGRYEVGELIGRGGMAEVHLGHDTRLSRSVAIKILRADLARDTSFLARFRREAQSAAGLNHPAIVAVYDSGEEHATESGGAPISIPYIVMEHVEGTTLRDILSEHRVLAPDEAARVTAGVLEALEYSHSKGIVHRDIKPANVMLTRAGAVKVMDFGIARALADTAATMTQTQAVIGTARYLSPEQAQGATVDTRSDLYSTGCLLFELLTGRTPFIGEPVSLVYQHIGEMPRPPSFYEPGVPPALDAITLHALVKDRDKRYQHARAFRADLQAVRAGRLIGSAARGTASEAAAAAVAATGRAATEAIGGATPTPTGNGAGHGGSNGRPPDEELPPSDARTPRASTLADDTAVIPVRSGEGKHRFVYTMLALAAIAVLAAVGYLGLTQLNKQQEQAPPTVAVPRLIGQRQDEATTLLTSKGFRPVAQPKANSAPEGLVFDQVQKPNTEQPQGSTVTFMVSTGPDSATIPYLRGQPEADAKRILEETYHLKVTVTQVNDASVAKGYVLGTDPADGTSVPARSTVSLQVASGNVMVPTVTGGGETEARNTLGAPEVQLRVTVKTEPSERPAGEVLRQSDDGKVVPVGTEITLVVSQPIVPPETVTSTTTPTPTTTTPSPTKTTPSPSTTTSPTPTKTTPSPSTTTTPTTTETTSPTTSPTTTSPSPSSTSPSSTSTTTTPQPKTPSTPPPAP